jgi:transglycosylase-like protein
MLLVVLALGLAPSAARAATSRLSLLHDQIETYRAQTWRWQTLMGKRRSPSRYEQAEAGLRYRTWVRNLWRRRAVRARRAAARPPHKAHWTCIQSHEARWTANTGNGYYGGLQMDLGFQRHYGAFLMRRKGTADNWTALEQMWVAERAHRAGRGFYPWPNTARICGLI